MTDRPDGSDAPNRERDAGTGSRPSERAGEHDSGGRHRRTVRRVFSVLLAVPPLYWLATAPGPDVFFPWPLWKQVAFVGFLAASIVVGWRPRRRREE